MAHRLRLRSVLVNGGAESYCSGVTVEELRCVFGGALGVWSLLQQQHSTTLRKEHLPPQPLLRRSFLPTLSNLNSPDRFSLPFLLALFHLMPSTDPPRKKRILFIHPDLGIGGAERLVVDAAVGLQDRGHEVTVYTSHCDPRHCFDEARNGTLSK